MQFTILSLLASVGFASAATTACAAQTIVDTCLGTEKAQLDACTPNDWACMCAAQQNVVTCYNNCPGDPEKSTANNVLIQYCGAASQASYYSSQTAQMKATASSTPATSATLLVTPTAVLASTATGSTTGSSSRTATAASTGAANAMFVPAGGLLAVAGVFAGLL